MKYVTIITEVVTWEVCEIDCYCRDGKCYGVFDTEGEAWDKVREVQTKFPHIALVVRRHERCDKKREVSVR